MRNSCTDLRRVREEVENALLDLLAESPLVDKHVLVVGVSTSEVLGNRIGSSGNDHVAACIFSGIRKIQEQRGFQLAFQCCEHLNRALVVSRQTLEAFNLEEVGVVPVPQAGGAMASYAFNHFPDAVMVESIQADAGIDIGGTLIGMHLKKVAVPVRPKCPRVGAAHVTMARTRPKLIGGDRAIYTLESN